MPHSPFYEHPPGPATSTPTSAAVQGTLIKALAVVLSESAELTEKTNNELICLQTNELITSHAFALAFTMERLSLEHGVTLDSLYKGMFLALEQLRIAQKELNIPDYMK